MPFRHPAPRARRSTGARTRAKASRPCTRQAEPEIGRGEIAGYGLAFPPAPDFETKLDHSNINISNEVLLPVNGILRLKK